MPKLKAETRAVRINHILKSAMVCFADNGYHQTTMDDIVNEAGLSKGGLYIYFKSKRELFIAMVEGFVSDFGLFAIPSSPESSVVDVLINLLDSMVETASSRQFREISSLMTHVWALNVHDPEISHIITRLYSRVRGQLQELLKAGVKDGMINPIDTAAVANIIVAVLEGLMIQSMVDTDAVDWASSSQTLKSMIMPLLQTNQGIDSVDSP